MKQFFNKYILVVALFLVQAFAYAQTTPPSSATDSIPTQEELPYNFSSEQSGSIFLTEPADKEVIYDAESGQYMMLEKIGDYTIKRPIYMSPKEYEEYRLKKDMLEYYKEKLDAVSGRTASSEDAQKNLLPKYYVNSNFFETLFGGNTIEVDARGSIDVRLGMLFQNVENPLISERNRKSVTFDFNQEVSASLTAKIGTRLQVNANYDTQSTFNFQNLIKLEYTPTEDDILQKIEVGNVSMPVQNSLIPGAQNLFGFKTQLQFGKTTVTGVFAEQRSQSRSLVAEGGSTINEFELLATDYDANRHFFLSQAFRDAYDTALENFPLVNSQINITKVEVWVTNRNATTTDDFRNIVAIADLAEGDPTNYGPVTVTSIGGQDPSNQANNLNTLLVAGGQIRNISTVENALIPFSMQQGRDYSILENARKLELNRDFRLHPQLGYISLNRRLADSEVLAVAYEYTVNGQPTVFKVGELSSDGILAPENIVVKLLRSEIIDTNIPLWDLMMKNIYSLGAYQLDQEGFRFELLYKDDATGQPINYLQNAVTTGVPDRTIMNLTAIDRLDQSQSSVAGGDGFFDYVNGITIDTEKGLVIFPKAEPFGENLETIITDPTDEVFVFNELYDLTQIQAKNEFQNKDKYLIKGYYRSENANGIPLGYNVQQGSVTVTSGGRQLVEGVDYVINYSAGRLEVINPSLIASNAPINISVETNNLFNLQTRRFTGVDVQHKFSDNFVAGASFFSLNEKPLTQKALFGNEPMNNTMFGINTAYNTTVPKLTKWVNHLPNIDTDVESNFSIRADAAYLIPGTPKGTDLLGKPTSYLDDFEGSQTPIDMKSPTQWFLASTPQGQSTTTSGLNFGGDTPTLGPVNFDYANDRAKMSWYTIDQLFYGSSSLQPGNIDVNELSRAEVRRVNYQELFPEIDLDVTQTSNVRTLDLAFFPSERGPYNNNTAFASSTNNPEDSWAGITRAISTTDFQQANVEYIQFWVMDPYENYSIGAAEGLPSGINPNDPTNQVGDLYFNLGNISEDILKDNRKMYENGLPEDGIKTDLNTYNYELPTVETPWGYVPRQQSFLYAFADGAEQRANQDVGLDGANDAQEANIYSAFSSTADPAGDNYIHFRDGFYDDVDGSIITRYKNYNNTQGNTPTNPEFSATTYPDTEDINKDQTMNTIESYYQYKVSMNANDLVVGQNNIVDERVVSVTTENGGTQNSRWLQFRIPISSGEPVNGISSFQSIRFMRMFLTKFKMPIVLRFGELELVRGDWRRYTKTLPFPTLATPNPTVANLTSAQLNNFEVGVVNIQENENRTPINYVLPPGVQRERLQGSTTIQQQNEQSVYIRVTDLPGESMRAIYKNVSADIRIFKNFELFTHAENFIGSTDLVDDELSAIVRFGSDLNDNFYQIELPLKVTDAGATLADDIWPEENRFNELLEEIAKLKLARFEDPAFVGNYNVLYPAYDASAPVEKTIRVKGNPNLANIQTIMLGVRNNNKLDKSAEVWFNEMRVSDFDNEGGWAAVVSADANIADFANISATGRIETAGFGAIDQRVNERAQEETKQYDLVTSVNAGQLLPKKWGIKLPVNYSISEEIIDPKFDPQYQDILFDDTNETNSPNRNDGQDYTKRRSISVLNVRKERTNPEKKPRFYDVENLALSYAYNETFHRDYNIKKYVDQNVRASANYNYSFQPKSIEPFKNIGFLKGKAFKFIKDFNVNLLPTNIGVNANVIRSYNEQLSRTLIQGLPELPTLQQRNYLFDWDYNIAYDLTKSLNFTFTAANNNRYDEFTNSDDIRLHDNFFEFGRQNHYHQTLNATYKLPIDKLPLLDFVNANYTYTADFDWQAGSPSYVGLTGNTVQNANTHNFSADLNFTKFYKNIGLDKLLLTTKKKKNAKGKEVKKVKKRSKKSRKKAGSIIYDVLTSVKKLRVNYTENNGTFLPGYIPEVGFLGRDNVNGSLAPTLGFVFGGQYDDFLQTSAANGWLVQSPGGEYYNKTFSKSHYNKFDYNLTVRPFKTLDIELTGNKIYTKQLSQQYDYTSTGVLDTSAPLSEVGNFSVTYGMFKTAFADEDQLFQDFKEYRTTIADRLAANSGLPVSGYGVTSQDVMLPAFLAAYSGKSADGVKLNPFRDFPIPNWKATYKGLMKVKWFKKHFRSFNVTHGYRSSYVIAGFSNNLQYDATNPTATDLSGNYFTKRLFNNASLLEEFNPLIKVDVKLKNSFSFKGELRKDRRLDLNFNNNTLTQISGKEYIFGLGYRVKDLKMKMRFAGKKRTFKGDLNLRADISLRDNRTLIRAVDTENDQVTGGQTLFSLKFLAEYALTKNLTASFFYDQNSSKYAISTTFPRSSIASGLNIRYQFGN